MNVAEAPVGHERASLRVPILWGFVVGAINAAAPLGLLRLEPATVYAIVLAAIAAVYVGFAVADGRPRVIAVEVVVALLFVLLATASAEGTAWLLVVGYGGHGSRITGRRGTNSSPTRGGGRRFVRASTSLLPSC